MGCRNEDLVMSHRAAVRFCREGMECLLPCGKDVHCLYLAVLLVSTVAVASGRDAAGAEEPSALEQVRDYIAQATESGEIVKTNEQWRLHLPRFPEVTFRGDAIFVGLETNRGDAKIRFLSQGAPNHVANLMYLVELGFYDGVVFQYMLSGERVQTGCPIGDGRGTPGYTFAGEYGSGLKHDRAGLLSMANAGRNTDGCQFFITLGPMPWMDGRHTIFGEVVEGMETLHAIGKGGAPRLGIPRERIHIKRAWIEEVGDHEIHENHEQERRGD